MALNLSNVIDLNAHRFTPNKASPAGGPGRPAPPRALTPSERAALSFEGGERIIVRRAAGLVRGHVETIALIHGQGRIGIRISAGRSTGALANFDALEVEPDLAGVLHGVQPYSTFGGAAGARAPNIPLTRPRLMRGPDQAEAREDQQ